MEVGGPYIMEHEQESTRRGNNIFYIYYLYESSIDSIYTFEQKF